MLVSVNLEKQSLARLSYVAQRLFWNLCPWSDASYGFDQSFSNTRTTADVPPGLKHTFGISKECLSSGSATLFWSVSFK